MQSEALVQVRNRYKREVCVFMVDGQDVNRVQVKAGMAWWYRRYQREQSAEQRSSYEAAEATARARSLGLWTDADPVPPWEWRRAKREN